jgi:hypothetical protein
MLKVYITFVVCLLSLIAGCKKDEPLPVSPHHTYPIVFLDTVLVEPTEIDLHLTTLDSIHNSNTFFRVLRDSVVIFSRFILQKDTIITDTGLSPSHLYHYSANQFRDSVNVGYSKVLIVRTMDTTSHNFVWEVDTIGDGNGSVLFDVAIINDTLAYAVGAIYKRDSSGHYNTDPYNLARWNGVIWQVYSLYFPLYNFDCTLAGYYSPVVRTVFAFDTKSILISDGGNVAKWNGDSLIYLPCIGPGTGSGEIIKIWGASVTNFYLVGRNGTIIHYDGATWQKMESGTNMDLTDVWGSPDGSIVWVCGWSQHRLGTFLLKNENNAGWQLAYEGTRSEFSIRSDSLSGPYIGVYTPNNRRIYVASDAGVYKANYTTHGEAERLSFTSTYFPGFPSRLRGNGPNELTIVGQNTFIAHYNGSSWRWYSNVMSSNGMLYSIDQKGNLVVAVGENYDPINSRGLVFIGRR